MEISYFYAFLVTYDGALVHIYECHLCPIIPGVSFTPSIFAVIARYSRYFATFSLPPRLRHRHLVP